MADPEGDDFLLDILTAGVARNTGGNEDESRGLDVGDCRGDGQVAIDSALAVADIPQVLDEDDALLMSMLHPTVRKKVKHAQRSDTLLQHARSVKKELRADRLLQEKDAEIANKDAALSRVTSIAPSLAPLVGKQRQRRSIDEQAKLVEFLSVQPPIRHNNKVALQQHRAQSVLVKATTNMQDTFLHEFLFPNSSNAERAPLPMMRTIAVAHQFDEAVQRCQSMKPRFKYANMRQSHAPRSCKMFCQLNTIHTFVRDEPILDDDETFGEHWQRIREEHEEVRKVSSVVAGVKILYNDDTSQKASANKLLTARRSHLPLALARALEEVTGETTPPAKKRRT